MGQRMGYINGVFPTENMEYFGDFQVSEVSVGDCICCISPIVG
jgi:hypothetical protein